MKTTLSECVCLVFGTTSPESSSTPSTPRYHYSLLNNSNASMPDLSKKLSPQNHGNINNSFRRLRKLEFYA
ncbi:uncharacterized protein OCT59_026700 [Rhizophagus irregularis]|uniref:uncharacterized protein n=1 Tax=Rhizophagus irregularis TaxID=588596 RepID=UPI0033203C88|nr:hypothetical protein OCT59_026700 [Rhizophagus irregularis]